MHRQWAEQFLMQQWGSLQMVSRGVLYQMLDYPGFVAFQDGKLQGIITYRIEKDACEVLVLTSTAEGQGIGSALVDRVKQAAKAAGCKRCWLITTNDNTHAIRWYQKRGFTIAAIHINALAESRKLKPEIPLIGNDGIPLRDEIEFEIILA
jgi:ribosomal protein S18 acetylase RimI-like enzyme